MVNQSILRGGLLGGRRESDGRVSDGRPVTRARGAMARAVVEACERRVMLAGDPGSTSETALDLGIAAVGAKLEFVGELAGKTDADWFKVNVKDEGRLALGWRAGDSAFVQGFRDANGNGRKDGSEPWFTARTVGDYSAGVYFQVMQVEAGAYYFKLALPTYVNPVSNLTGYSVTVTMAGNYEGLALGESKDLGVLETGKPVGGGVDGTEGVFNPQLGYSFDLGEVSRVVLEHREYGNTATNTPIYLVQDTNGDGRFGEGEALGAIGGKTGGMRGPKHVVRQLQPGRYFVVIGEADASGVSGQLAEAYAEFVVERLAGSQSAGATAATAGDLGVLGAGSRLVDNYDLTGAAGWYKFRVEVPATAQITIGGGSSALPGGTVYFDHNRDGVPNLREEFGYNNFHAVLHRGEYFLRVSNSELQGKLVLTVTGYSVLPESATVQGTASTIGAPEILVERAGDLFLAGAVPQNSRYSHFKLVLPEGSFWRVNLAHDQGYLTGDVFRDKDGDGTLDYGEYDYEAIASNERETMKPGTYDLRIAGGQGLEEYGNFSSGITYIGKIGIAAVANREPTVSFGIGHSSTIHYALLNAEARDVDGNLAGIELYRESNGAAGVQVGEGGDERVSVDVSLYGDYFEYKTSGEARGEYTAEVPGLQRFYARAVDTMGATSAWVSREVTFTNVKRAYGQDRYFFVSGTNADGTARALAMDEPYDFGTAEKGSVVRKTLPLVWSYGPWDEAPTVSFRIEGGGYRLVQPVPRTLGVGTTTDLVVELNAATAGQKNATLVMEWRFADGRLGVTTERIPLTGLVLGASGGDVPGGGGTGGGDTGGGDTGGGNTGGGPPVVDSANVAILGGVKGIKAGTFVAGKALGKASVKVGLPDGGTVARDVAISYYLSADEVWDENDVLVGSTTTNLKLSGKKTKSVTTALTAPVLDGDGQAIVAGSYRVLAVVDSGGAMTEANEADNVGMVPAAVTIEPQRVGVSGVVMGGGKLAVGKTGTIKVRVTNTGNIDLDASLVMSLFASGDQVLDVESDASLGPVGSTIKLKAGASRVVSYRYQRSTTSALSGQQHVFGRVDGSLMGVGLAAPVVFAPLKPTLFVPPPGTGGGSGGAVFTTSV